MFSDRDDAASGFTSTTEATTTRAVDNHHDGNPLRQAFLGTLSASSTFSTCYLTLEFPHNSDIFYNFLHIGPCILVHEDVTFVF